MPGSYVSRTSAAFSSADQRLRRSWLIVTTSIVCLFLVICTVLFLSVRMTHRLCLVNQGAISHVDRKALPFQVEHVGSSWILGHRSLADLPAEFANAIEPTGQHDSHVLPAQPVR